jgi:hypothetical protein
MAMRSRGTTNTGCVGREEIECAIGGFELLAVAAAEDWVVVGVV